MQWLHIMVSLLRARVQSLVGKLRSHKLCAAKKTKLENLSAYHALYLNVAHSVYNSLLFILYVQLNRPLFRNPSLPVN